MKDAFASMFGDNPFGFQLQVAEHLLEGRSVILRAPTELVRLVQPYFPFYMLGSTKRYFLDN